MGTREPIRGLYWQQLVAMVGAGAFLWLFVRFCGGSAPAPGAASSPPESAGPSTSAAVASQSEASGGASAVGHLPAAAPGARAGDPGAASPAPTTATAAPGAARGSVLVEGEARSGGGAPPAGSLDKEDIQAAIRAVKPTIAECYEKALAHDPDLSGRIVVEFTIEAVDGGGGVTAGEVNQTDMNAPFFEACVLKEIVGVPFPAPVGGGVVKVSYPFNFENAAD